ncbi:MAG TPA: type II secretion system protein [Candidatus Hydrogenedentes bacterium]|nr:type II secretion system protein [Candidatus Hydrogenedentota bacterium]
MKTRHSRGFTLLELLTVIAIIAILAGFIAAALPRILEKAKIRRMVATMTDIRTAMAAYYTDNNTYPPAYGYTIWNADLNDCDPQEKCFVLKPYLYFIRFYNDPKHYDEFSESYDTNRDGHISLLEFSPIGDKDVATSRVTFPSIRYVWNNLQDQVQKQLETSPRPYIYIPVNMRQFKKAKEYWIKNAHFYANAWDPNDPGLETVLFPPPEYDAFALISPGPGGSTFGVIPSEPLGTEDPFDVYFVMALRAYFLATRDLNDNGEKDFDFTARTTRGEAKFDKDHPYTVTVGGNTTTADNRLPDPKAPNGYGPFIYVYP